MTLLIFFALILSTIILAIVLQRIIHCPILVGLAFFAIFSLVAAFLGNTTFIIFAILFGVLAFIAAFFDCLFTHSGFFRNNRCLSCDDNNGRCNCRCNNNGNTNDERLTILNSNGEIVARINGNSITCISDNDNNENNCGCSCHGRKGLNTLNFANENGTNLTNGSFFAENNSNNTGTNSSCGCCNGGRYR